MTIVNYAKQKCELHFYRLAFKYDFKYNRIGVYFNSILLCRMNLERFVDLAKEFAHFSNDIIHLRRKIYESED